MLIKGDNLKIRKVRNIPLDKKTRIDDFLLGAIYTWCKNRKNEWFSVRDLMGGENADWTNTPLIYLYDRQINKGKTQKKAFDQAAKDIGNIVKELLSNDTRNFETDGSMRTRRYIWIP